MGQPNELASGISPQNIEYYLGYSIQLNLEVIYVLPPLLEPV